MDKEYYLTLRNKYLPETLKLIFILESRGVATVNRFGWGIRPVYSKRGCRALGIVRPQVPLT